MVVAVPALAGQAPYEDADAKALHPGKPHVNATRYVQPRYYVQPRMTTVPRMASTPRTVEGRRTFSYEPAPAMMETAAPQYVAPFRSGPAPLRHTWENATAKGLGQIR